ncbi:MAG TPA: response regulator [Cytophagales bacterium]|nr:response regulator [Cytophagales bacterium]
MKKCKSILLIEDSDLDNYAHRRLIEKLEITEDLKIFKNGLEAINYFKILTEINSPPDIIFLDLNMPIMDGFGFLEHFKSLLLKNKDNIKIVVLTSSSSPVDQKKANMLGSHEYLIKPLTKEKIKEVYEKIFN